MSGPGERLALFASDDLKTELPCKIIRYPDGQLGAEVDFPLGKNAVIFRSVNSFDALHEVMVVNSALNRNAKDTSLVSPYMIGGRSDRKFHPQGTHYLNDVIGPILTSCSFAPVRVLDPHSGTMELCIAPLAEMPLGDFHRWVSLQVRNPVIVSPDAGAEYRCVQYCRVNELNPDDWIVACKKVRDLSTGRIISTEIEAKDFAGRDVLIVDDICDGGATFIELGKKLRGLNCGRLSLAVSHGIFSKAFAELDVIFDHIYCTDSYQTIADNQMVSQYKLSPGGNS